MTSACALPAYIIVTPVRDEARFIGETLVSVLTQTHLPIRWIIVDDGSTDLTPVILREHTQGLPWVTVVSTRSTERNLGCAEVLAFQCGFAEITPDATYEFVVKLDGDLRLPTNYFERVLERMSVDTRWGIASGVYCEDKGGHWVPIAMPTYHAAGASKVVRRECFEQIGGFVARKGWDTVDEIRAGLHGWHTGHFDDIPFQHLKPEGVAMGRLQTHRFHGDIYYQTGGGPLFLLFKAVHRMLAASPPLLGGLAMLWGYLAPLLSRRSRLVSADEARFYRSMLNMRLTRPVAKLFAFVRS